MNMQCNIGSGVIVSSQVSQYQVKCVNTRW